MISSTAAKKDVEADAKLLAQNRSIKPAVNKKVTKASDLKVGQLVFVKDHQKGTFDLSYVFDHMVASIVNDSTVTLTTLDGNRRYVISTTSNQQQH